MKASSRKTILTVSVAILMTGTLSVIFLRSKSDSKFPMYEGRTVEDWFYGRTGSSPFTAFKKMGIQWVPYLIERATGNASPLNTIYIHILDVLPDEIKTQLPRPAWSTVEVRSLAWHHLNQLEPDALVPFAKDIIMAHQFTYLEPHNSNEYMVAKKAATNMPESEIKKTFFQEHVYSSDPIIQLHSAIQLSTVDPSNTNGIYILINALNDADLVAHMTFNTDSLPIRKDVVWTNTYPVKVAQKQIHEALSIVAPGLADQYSINDPEP